jgi:spermidine synthase
MLSGVLLCRASSVLATKRGPAAGLGHGYMLDAVGSILGGLIFSFVLVHFVPHGVMVLGTGLLLLAAAVCCQLLDGQSGRASLAVVATIILYFFAAAAERRTVRALALGQPVHLNVTTPYGHLMATKVGEQYNFFLNGVPYFSTGQHEAAEERVHLAMLQRPDAERVLLLGAPIPEILAELLKYPRVQVDCVHPDRRLGGQIEKVASHILSDPRVHLLSADPRFYVRACGRRYDVVLLLDPLPETLQFHRLYTVEFFREMRVALRQDGVLGLPFGDFTGYLSREQARAVATCYNTLRAVFGNVRILPAAQIYFLASDGFLSSDYAKLFTEANIKTTYVGASYFETMITADREATLQAAIQVPSSVNRDFQPKLLSFTLRRWLDEHGYKIGILEVAIALGILAYAGSLRGPAVAIFASGYSAAGLEYVLLFLLQVLAGALYYQVSIVFTAFRLGLRWGNGLERKLGFYRRR